jgi:putative endonuclease
MVAGNASTDSRREYGMSAEQVACQMLTAEGFVIVERNFRCRLGELDIVAHENGVLVFVEVRSRSHARFGAAMVLPAKQRQVTRVASMYLALRKPSAHRMRFDVVIITAGVPTLIRDAWRLGG